MQTEEIMSWVVYLVFCALIGFMAEASKVNRSFGGMALGAVMYPIAFIMWMVAIAFFAQLVAVLILGHPLY